MRRSSSNLSPSYRGYYRQAPSAPRYVLPPRCFHRAAKRRLASLGFVSHDAYRCGSLRTYPRFTSPRYVPPAGFDYPLGGFLLPRPLDHFSGPSALGVFPFRVLLPCEEPYLSQGLAALLPLVVNAGLSLHRQLQLQSLAPSARAALTVSAFNADGSRYSLGVSIFEAFSLAPP
jgi:hypothetical protein